MSDRHYLDALALAREEQTQLLAELPAKLTHLRLVTTAIYALEHQLGVLSADKPKGDQVLTTLLDCGGRLRRLSKAETRKKSSPGDVQEEQVQA